MSLDATKPTDQELVSQLPYYIRQNRASINAFEDLAGSEIVFTTLNVSPGVTTLVVGTDLSIAKFEIVRITSSGVATISRIEKGTQGQIKVFVFQNDLLSFVDGTKTLGQLYLNQLPIGSVFDAQQDDIVALLNIDGDGSSNYGYWKELWRQLSVK